MSQDGQVQATEMGQAWEMGQDVFQVQATERRAREQNWNWTWRQNRGKIILDTFHF